MQPRELVSGRLSKAVQLLGLATPFSRGGDQEAACLNVEFIQGWLFTIDTSRIKDDDVRKKVQLYQRECYGVLHTHFTGKVRARIDIEGEPEQHPSMAERLRLVTEARQTFDTLAARQLWFEQGLPIVPAMLQPEQPSLFTYNAVKRDDLQDQAA